MFIAMNRFKVIKEECKAFENVWLTRDSRLNEVKGFVAFHLLRGPEREDHVLYSSHTIWATQEDFITWTNRSISAPPTNKPASANRSHSDTRNSKDRSHPSDRK